MTVYLPFEQGQRLAVAAQLAGVTTTALLVSILEHGSIEGLSAELLQELEAQCDRPGFVWQRFTLPDHLFRAYHAVARRFNASLDTLLAMVVRRGLCWSHNLVDEANLITRYGAQLRRSGMTQPFPGAPCPVEDLSEITRTISLPERLSAWLNARATTEGRPVRAVIEQILQSPVRPVTTAEVVTVRQYPRDTGGETFDISGGLAKVVRARADHYRVTSDELAAVYITRAIANH